MAAFNPFYNEETGWTPLDQLEPWQQALMNPGANNPGMSMPGYDQNLMSMLGNQSTSVNPGAGTGGSMMSPDPYTWTGGQNSGAGNAAFNNVFNNGTTPRNTPTIASPALLANNMSMQGAENVGGVGMYTGSNGPLDTTRFTPVQGQQQNGPPRGSIPTGDPNTWITPWGATYTTPGSINNSSSAAYDAYRQRAFGDMMGPMGRGPSSNPYQELTDVLRQAPGSINAQTFQGYLGSLQGQQTGPNPPQQTAPLPRQGGGQGGSVSDPYGDSVASMQRQEQVRQAMRSLGISEYGPALTPQQVQQLTQRLGYNPITQAGGPSQRPGTAGAPVTGSPGMMGPRPIDPSQAGTGYGPPVYQVGANGQRQWQDPRTGQWLDVMQQNGYPWEGRGTSPAMGMPQGYGNGPGGNLPSANPINWGAMGNSRDPNSAYQQYARQVEALADPNHPAGRSDYVYNPQTGAWGPGPNSPIFPGQMQVDPAQMAAQFSSDPASQQAYLRDMFGGGQQDPFGWYPQPAQAGGGVDFRAATFGGGGSLFPATAGSGGSNIPNTTNPVNTQYSTPQAGFGGATNRRGGFGGMSLFGNQFGSGGSTGFGGTQPSQYRGAGSYGRPASYGQSQRPY